MNSKTCDNCKTTEHDRRELDSWFQIAGRGNVLNSSRQTVMDACSRPCGVAVMETLAASHAGSRGAIEGLGKLYSRPIDFGTVAAAEVGTVVPPRQAGVKPEST